MNRTFMNEFYCLVVTNSSSLVYIREKNRTLKRHSKNGSLFHQEERIYLSNLVPVSSLTCFPHPSNSCSLQIQFPLRFILSLSLSLSFFPALLQQSKRKKGPSRISATTIIFYTLTLVMLVFILFVTYRHWSNRTRLQQERYISVSEDENTSVESKKSDLPGYAVVITSKGSIIVELYKESAPEGPGATEDWNLMRHEAFMLGTSKGKYFNKVFDLFITTAPIPDLNEKLIVFGRVIKGQDIVQEIEEVDTDEHYQPKVSIGILDVALKQLE
ncbi:Peptidyl-prolyl cis-trans isomerase CYP21-4 [Glycine soja]